MKFDYPYQLEHDDARARLEALGQYLSNRHGLRVNWAGDRVTFRGRYLVISIEGELTIGERVVHVTGKDPGFLWRRRAIDYLRKKLDAYLDPSRPVSELPTGS